MRLQPLPDQLVILGMQRHQHRLGTRLWAGIAEQALLLLPGNAADPCHERHPARSGSRPAINSRSHPADGRRPSGFTPAACGVTTPRAARVLPWGCRTVRSHQSSALRRIRTPHPGSRITAGPLPCPRHGPKAVRDTRSTASSSAASPGVAAPSMLGSHRLATTPSRYPAAPKAGHMARRPHCRIGWPGAARTAHLSDKKYGRCGGLRPCRVSCGAGSSAAFPLGGWSHGLVGWAARSRGRLPQGRERR